MLALIYRFEQDDEAAEKLAYLIQYQAQLVKAKIRFEKLNNVPRGISLIQNFYRSRKPPQTLPNITSNLQEICKADFTNEYVERYEECKQLISSNFEGNERNEKVLSSLRSFYERFLRDDARFLSKSLVYDTVNCNMF